MLIAKPFLNQILVESLTSDFSSIPKAEKLLTPKINCILDDVLATNDLSNVDAQKEVLFYHPVKGYIGAYPRWGYDFSSWNWIELFSTLNFIQNLKLAEDAPNVVAHFIHINSGGGEAWALDIAASTMRECKKPIYVFIEGCCASGGYYLACGAQMIKAFTQNDQIGCIGTMSSVVDISGRLEQLGIKEFDIYATRSDLKNRRESDILTGNAEQFITEVLDPIQSQFESAVRTGRKVLNDLPDDHPVFRGAMFSAIEAEKIGLIDGVVSDLGVALCEAYELGKTTKTNNSLLTQI